MKTVKDRDLKDIFEGFKFFVITIVIPVLILIASVDIILNKATSHKPIEQKYELTAYGNDEIEDAVNKCIFVSNEKWAVRFSWWDEDRCTRRFYESKDLRGVEASHISRSGLHELVKEISLKNFTALMNDFGYKDLPDDCPPQTKSDKDFLIRMIRPIVEH